MNTPQKPVEFNPATYAELFHEKKSHILQTACGYSVRILCMTRQHATHPIVGLMMIDGEEQIFSWSNEGESRYVDPNYALVLVPKPPASLGWVVAYLSATGTIATTSLTTLDEIEKLGEVYELVSEPVQLTAKKP